MAKLYRVVVYHPSTDNYWYSTFEDRVDLENLKNIIKDMCKDGAYFSFEDANDNLVFFTKNFIQECVFSIEGSKE